MTRLSFDQSVRVLSWVGDLLLVGTALTLLIMRGGTLTPGMASVLVLAIFLGGLLPISVYCLDYLVARNATRAAEARAPESLRQALVEMDRLVDRVETAAADASKTTLSARQLPSIVETRAAAISDAAGRLETALANLGDWTEKLPKVEAASLQNEATSLDLQPLEARLAELRTSLDAALSTRGDELKAVGERLSVIEQMLQRNPDSTLAPTPRPESADEPLDPGASDANTPPKAQKRAPSKKKSAKKKVAKKSVQPEPPPKSEPAPAEAQLFDHESVPKELPDGQSSLVVKALVGVNNRVYVRGDPPLSWEMGRPLNPTGIGEWRLDLNEVSEPLKIEIRLNDEIAAKGNLLELQSGRITRASPIFPPANEPF